MSIRDWFRRSERRDLTVPWDQGPPKRSANVSVHEALRLAPVFAAGRLLASSVASLPIQVYRKTGDRREQLPLPSLLVSPSVQGTRHDWLWRLMTSLVYRGNAVGLITFRNADEQPTAIEWLHPDEISVQDSQPYGPGSFRQPVWYWRGQVISAENLIHIPWFTVPERVWGLSPLAAYASSVATGLAAQKFSMDWFDAGGVPPGTFTNAAQEVSQTDAETISQRLVNAIRRRRPIVYGKDWTYTPISISPNEAKFVETMRLTASQIAAIYGIPPEMIGGDTGKSMTYSNTEQQAIQFVQFTLLPWLTKIESHLSALLPKPQYVKFNVDGLIRTDATTRYANYQIARGIGLMNVDEIRALEDMPPLPNGQGQDYTPLNVLRAASSAMEPAALRAVDAEVVPLELEHGARAVSKLQTGQGHALWKYWTHGEGLARWVESPTPYRTLVAALLSEGVPAHEVHGLAAEIFHAVFHQTPYQHAHPTKGH